MILSGLMALAGTMLDTGDHIGSIVAGLIAFGGVAVVAFLRFREWRRNHRDDHLEAMIEPEPDSPFVHVIVELRQLAEDDIEVFITRLEGVKDAAGNKFKTVEWNLPWAHGNHTDPYRRVRRNRPARANLANTRPDRRGFDCHSTSSDKPLSAFFEGLQSGMTCQLVVHGSRSGALLLSIDLNYDTNGNLLPPSPQIIERRSPSGVLARGLGGL